MNKNIALYFDIDGTISSSGKISESLIETFAKLYQQGNIDLYLSTGRSIRSIESVKEILPYFKGYNFGNGGYIELKNGIKMFDTIDPVVVKDLVSVLNKEKISYGAITYNNDYWVFYDEKYRKEYTNPQSFKGIEIKEDDDFWYSECIQIWILEQKSVLEKISSKFPKLKFYYWRTFGADVISSSRSKGTGIDFINYVNNYDINNTYAFGDSENDIPMFNHVGHSIAMGNATLETKNAASEVIGSINEDGLNIYLQRFIKPTIKSS